MHKSIAAICLAVSLTLEAQEVSGTAETGSDALLIKPAFVDRSPFLPKAEAAAREKYPALFNGKFTGTVAITVDLNLDGAILATSVTQYPAGPITERSGTKAQRDAYWDVVIHDAYSVAGGVGTKFVGWFGKKRDNGLYLNYRVLKWPLDLKRSVQRVRAAVASQYPQYYAPRPLSASGDEAEAVITVVMNDNGEIEAATLIENASQEELSDRKMLDRFMELGLKPEQLTHRGQTVNRGEWHDRNLTSPLLIIQYAWRRREGDPVDDLFQTPDVLERVSREYTRAQVAQTSDDAFVKRYFPTVWSEGLPKDAAAVWILFSREGQVLDTGTCAELDSRAVEEILRARYRGIRTIGGGMSAVTIPSGSKVDFYYFWIAEDSQTVPDAREK